MLCYLKVVIIIICLIGCDTPGAPAAHRAASPFGRPECPVGIPYIGCYQYKVLDDMAYYSNHLTFKRKML